MEEDYKPIISKETKVLHPRRSEKFKGVHTDDGLGCDEPVLGRRFVAEIKFPADTDLLPGNDVLRCEPLGATAGDSFGVEPACGELEREAEGIDAFDDAFFELLAVGLSKERYDVCSQALVLVYN
ncbi:hypothetical protein P5673_004630 [Acropora cervicornis]|uniref:Uncharacterized protein n=1 Tax=Acropora cervicornis TaxID=6130 RepID=A0AAD9R0J4_ACRCE|nr:hypothetical protein P5673_004630 [Acropora cervicornis]